MILHALLFAAYAAGLLLSFLLVLAALNMGEDGLE